MINKLLRQSMQKQQATIHQGLPKRNYESQRLHIYDQGSRNSLSGVKATVFGGTSALGSTIGASLTRIGSTNIYPHRAAATIWDTRYKELKATADLGHKAAIKLYDFTDEREIAHSFKDSNVVISTIGSKSYMKNEKEYEDANIRVPMAIAKAVKNNPKIKRFIYFGAAGSDPNSASRRLRTKWIGEQEVKEIYPDVTILRPTMIMNLLHPNPTFVGKWMMQMKMFNRTHFAVEGANALLQPVYVNDLVLAVMNCLKMEETIGQTYDLGGPHVYTYEEVFEMFANICNLKPYTVSVPMEDVCEMQNYKWWASYWRNIFRTWLTPEFIAQECVDVVVNENNKTFEDLYIKPISFGHKAHEYVNDIYWLNNSGETTKREGLNN